MSVIEFQQVRKQFTPNQTVLDSVSFSVEKGEVVALIGSNGAGKTTLIKALFDLVTIDDGSIHINSLPHTQHRARQGVAYLPEQFRPPHYLSGMQFLHAVAQLSGAVASTDTVHALCESLSLETTALAVTIKQYSKGMGQKLGLIGALLSGSQVLVLDEPMSGLDAHARLLLKNKLADLCGAGRSVLLSTHMLNDVEQFCHRVAVLHAGRVQFIGAPRQFCEQFAATTLEAAYIKCLQTCDTLATSPAP